MTPFYITLIALGAFLACVGTALLVDAFMAVGSRSDDQGFNPGVRGHSVHNGRYTND